MQFTVHDPMDANFEYEMSQLNDYIQTQVENPFFRCICTDPSDFRPTERTIIARNSEIAGFLQIDYDRKENIVQPMKWVQVNANNPVVNSQGKYITYQQFSRYTPLNNEEISTLGFINALESYERGTGKGLIQVTKDIADTILLDSVNDSERFYKKQGFCKTKFKVKKGSTLKPLYFWQR